MAARWIKRLLGLLVGAALVAATVWALLPKPVPVDLATIDRGPLAVTVDEEGIARIRDVFRVSMPVVGRVERLPVEVGDAVFRGVTAVARIHPVDPPFLDVRSRRELEAAVEAARAAVNLATAQVAGAVAADRLAEADLERAQRLAKVGAVSARALEKAVADVDTAKAAVGEARAALSLRESELSSAEARLIEPEEGSGGARDSCCLTLRAPVDGTVLSLLTKSEQVVPAGAALLEIGNPADIEVVVHLLSSDAVNVHAGSAARLDEWGGPPLAARVRRVDPAAYTKVSALGIEEQRVDAVLDIVDPPETWRNLGHAFRVMVHIAIWQSEDVVRVPLGALFRRGSDWAVFKVVDGRAVETRVTIGHRTDTIAEVTGGLAEGDAVVLHPSDLVIDGVRIVPRDGG